MNELSAAGLFLRSLEQALFHKLFSNLLSDIYYILTAPLSEIGTGNESVMELLPNSYKIIAGSLDLSLVTFFSVDPAVSNKELFSCLWD